MKDIVTKINESATSFSDIKNYAKSWTSEWPADKFSEIMKNIFYGLQKGVADNKKVYNDESDKSFIEESEKVLKEIEKTLFKYNYI